MTHQEFTAKWEEALRTSEALWKYSCDHGYGPAALEEGQRMSAISEMLDDYKHIQNETAKTDQTTP